MSASISSSISLLICVEYLYRCLCIVQSDDRASICANTRVVCFFLSCSNLFMMCVLDLMLSCAFAYFASSDAAQIC